MPECETETVTAFETPIELNCSGRVRVARLWQRERGFECVCMRVCGRWLKYI